jgi:transcriptional regulator with XRE-family HTH domain
MARTARGTSRGNKIATEFGKLLAELRKKRGLSQEGFAAIAGFHKNSIGMLERGEISPKLKAILDLADALEMPASQLLALLQKKLSS